MVSLPPSVLGTMSSDTRGEQRFCSVWRTLPAWCRIWKMQGRWGSRLWEDSKWPHHWLRWVLQCWILLLPLPQLSYIRSFSQKISFLPCHSRVSFGDTLCDPIGQWSCAYTGYTCKCIRSSQTLWVSTWVPTIGQHPSYSLCLSGTQFPMWGNICSSSVYQNTSKHLNKLNAEKTKLWTTESCLSLNSPMSLGKFCQCCAPNDLWVLGKWKHKAGDWRLYFNTSTTRGWMKIDEAILIPKFPNS